MKFSLAERVRIAALGTPSPPSAPADRSKEACDLALHEALTAQERSTRGAAGPKRWAQGAFSQHGFDDMDSQDTRQGPNGQNQRGKGLSLLNRVE
jgi:hypothetical protein